MAPRTHTLLRLAAVAALVVAAMWPSASRQVQRTRSGHVATQTAPNGPLATLAAR
ncbi:MAG: hypothetical protein U0174_20840 [Polyangiaceae bacterium]